MKIIQVNITHIFHSCFSVELEGYQIVFDYFKGTFPHPKKGLKTIFVATHCHSDHFNKEILDIKEMPDCTYILSSDIKELYRDKNIIYLKEDMDAMKLLYKSPNVHFVGPDERQIIDNLRITTFGSTDRGISILIQTDHISLFHAGDLNYWYWENDSPEDKDKMKKNFYAQLSKISVYDVDIAFFPVDFRLGKNYDLGVKAFINTVDPVIVFPMHFKDHFGITNQLKASLQDQVDADIQVIPRRDYEVIVDIELD